MELSQLSLDALPQYLTDAQGNQIAIVLDLQTYQSLLDELEELRCQQGYEQAVAETEPEIQAGDYVTLEQYLQVLTPALFDRDKTILNNHNQTTSNQQETLSLKNYIATKEAAFLLNRSHCPIAPTNKQGRVYSIVGWVEVTKPNSQ